MEKYEIDINCDLGEGIGKDELLMPFLSSCNIACGGHAGDKTSMSKTIALAQKYDVKIGAHPGFEDKENFGRIELNLPEEEITQMVFNQLEAFYDIVLEKRAILNHVKPHGALYNLAAKDPKTASGILKAILKFDPKSLLYVPYKSVISELALKENIAIKYEGFLDRNYNDDLSLVSRKQENAVLTEPDSILKHLVRMVTRKEVKTILNHEVTIKAETFCIHGDNPNAVEVLKYLQTNLEKHNINIF